MTILFLCVANSARSQIAEGLARKIFSDSVKVESGGSRPAKQVNPLAVEIMAEIGIDISGHAPKPFLPGKTGKKGIIITLCAEQECPLPPMGAGTRVLRWNLPDPAAPGIPENQRLGAFRKVRDELEKRLSNLAQELSLSRRIE